MKCWHIPVTWGSYGVVEVEADTLSEAMEIAADESSDIPLPNDGDYAFGSWRLFDYDEDMVRKFYNHNQSDYLMEETNENQK